MPLTGINHSWLMPLVDQRLAMRAHIFDGRRIVIFPFQVRPFRRGISPAFDARYFEYFLRAVLEARGHDADILVGRRTPDYDLSIWLRHRAAFGKIERIALARHLIAVDLVAEKQPAIVAA